MNADGRIGKSRAAWSRQAAIAIAILAAAAAIEYAMGRAPWCRCGYVKFWHGVVHSSENSQHVTDWYTFTHVVHGVAFYVLLWAAARRLPPGARFVTAVLIESAWEVIENTPFTIERYRAGTIALDYYGDSIVNSVSDVVAMMIGYGFARVAPPWLSAVLVIVLEVGLLLIIRDNLTLNILMLISPVEAIKRWQTAG